MLDHYALLSRYIGRRVCITLYGQHKLWGRIANLCHDGVRLIDTATVGEYDEQEWLSHSLYGDDDGTGRPRYPETVIQFHHIVAITCADDDLPVPEDPDDQQSEPAPRERASSDSESNLDSLADQFLGADRLRLELGHGLVGLCVRDQNDLATQLRQLRRTLAKDFGVFMPTVRIVDNIRLRHCEYRVLVAGQAAACGEVRPEDWLSIDPEAAGDETPYEADGEVARWVSAEHVDRELKQGRTVVDAATLITARVLAVARLHADELLGIDDLRKLLERARGSAPALVDELVPHALSLGSLRKVLALLMSEGVPLRNLLRILESLASVHRVGTKDPEELVARIRVDLGRDLCQPLMDPCGSLPAILLDPKLEQSLWRAVRGQRLFLDSSTLQALVQKIETARLIPLTPRAPLVVEGLLRRPLREALARSIPGLTVLSYAELPAQISLRPVHVITAEEIPAPTIDAPAWNTLLAPGQDIEGGTAPWFATGTVRENRTAVHQS